MRAAGILAAVVVAAVVGVSAIAAAQAPPPTITVTASESSLALSSTGPLAAGPTRFAVQRPARDEVDLAIGALREGVTVAEFSATLRDDPDAALEMAHLDAGVTLAEGEADRAVTAILRPSSTYVAVNLTGENPADWEIVEFSTSGVSNGASPPRADARVRIVDLRFRGAKTLPRNGVVRFENAGWAPHFALAAPLRGQAKQRAVARALRRNREQALGRLLDFSRSIEPQGLITRGAVNYNEVRFPKRGRYVMVCFFEGHNAQGMFRFVRVR